MAKQKQVLNGKMRQILTVLHKKGGAMTALQIADETGFSYKTVTKYLLELEGLGILVRRKHDRKKKTN